jgi:hypothetical protein
MDKTRLMEELNYLAIQCAHLGDFMKIPSDKIASDEELRVVRRYASLAMEINKLRDFVSYLPDDEES